MASPAIPMTDTRTTDVPLDAISTVTAQALNWPETARALVISDQATYLDAAELLKGIKGLRGEVEATFGPIVSKAHAAHKEAVAQRKRADGPLNEAEHILKRGMVAFTREQEQLRREEQRRREKAARREEEGRRLAEAAALELEAEATGDTELAAEAEALVEAPIDVAPVFVEPTTPKAAGVSYRTTYKARVTNFSTFLSAVTANPQYHDLVTVNQGALNGLARSLKQRLDIPGVVVDVEQVAAVRGQ